MVRALLLSLALLIAVSPITTAPYQESQELAQITFTISDDVSMEDEIIVREGTRFAQEFLVAAFGTDVRQPVLVDVTYSEHDPALHASYEQPNLAVYNMWDLRGYSYLQKLRYAVHGYVHIWQYDQIADSKITETIGPPWLVEGSAEYLSLQAMVWAGLLSDQEVGAFLVATARGTAFGGPDTPLPPLAELQDASDFYERSIGCCTYGLSALAIGMLVESNGMESLAVYFQTMRTRAWHQAFLEAFGTSIADFYTAFEVQRPSLLTSQTTDISQLILTPMYNQQPGPLSIAKAPEEIAPGTQVLAFGWAGNGSHCTMTATASDGETLATYPTFADTYGLTIWLWSVPAPLVSTAVNLSFDCGATPVIIEIPVTHG